MASAVVLLSAGLDSTVNLYAAVREMKIVRALTLDYGQRAAVREISAAKKICSGLNVPHEVIRLDWMKNITKTSLVNTDENVPVGKQVSMDDLQQSNQTAKAVWVPNRNGVFLNIAASFAESLRANHVIVGFNKEEAATFPDNSAEYLKILDASFSLSTLSQVKVKCFTTEMNKTEIVRLGQNLNVPFDDLWPCYFAGDKLCGECESCQRFFRAMEGV